jgi:flagellar motor switch protein FliM
VVLSRFESDSTNQGSGFIDMVIPYVALKPVRDVLRSRVQTGDGNEESDKVWYSQLDDAVRDAELEIQILLGKMSMSMHQLQTMQPGDVLPFKKSESARAMIEDMPVFDVEVGALGSQVAVKIVQPISPNLQA